MTPAILTPTLKVSTYVSTKGDSAELTRLQADITRYTLALQSGKYKAGFMTSAIQAAIRKSQERIAELQAGIGGDESRPVSSALDPVFATARLDVGRVGVSDLKSPFIGR